MTASSIGTDGFRDHPEIRAHQFAEAAVSAWWSAAGADEIAIPLGVTAALALAATSGPAWTELASSVPALGPDGFASFLARVWGLFAITRPELSIRTGPFARWLEDGQTGTRRAAAFGTACALLAAGRQSSFPDTDLLGCIYQALANPNNSKTRGEVYASPDVAELLTRIKLADARAGQVIVDECAGTGSLLHAAARVLRRNGTDPRAMHWYAADIDQIAVAALAVNVHLWDLGPHVILTRADILTEPDWPSRAHDEQEQALRDHGLRLSVARLLAAEHVTSTPPGRQPGRQDRT